MLILAVPGIVIALTAAYVTEHLLRGPLVPDDAPAHRRLRRHVLPDGRGLGARRRGPGAGRAGGGGAARSASADVRSSSGSTLPLIGPGLAAAFCLVFLETATELTATLILIPTGVQTLATGFWAQQTNLSYSAAAPYAGHHGAHRRRAQLRARPLVRPAAGPHGSGRRRDRLPSWRASEVLPAATIGR